MDKSIKEEVNYAIDIVSNTLKDISEGNVHYFQRDGSFFAVSKEGFGFLTMGLPIYDSEGERDSFTKEVFTNSTDLLIPINSKERRKKLQASQKEYVEPILFGEDSRSFSLKSIIKIAESLNVLPEDGLVRLVDHDSRYHSHKYGYAFDGTDVWLDSARSMSRDVFFSFIRKSEDFILAKLKTDTKITKFAYASSGSHYQGEQFRLPKFGVVTPSLLLHLPIIDDHHPNELWTIDTEFSSNGFGKEFLVSDETETHKKSPFTIGLILNYQRINLINPEQANKDLMEYQTKQTINLEAIEKNLPAMRSYIDRLNNAHNTAFKQEIKDFN